jgi:tight adherence protein C
VPTLVERRRRRRLARAVADDLPEVLDLMALVAGAGFTPAFAVEAVGRHSSGPVGLELARAHRQAGGGARLADALDGLTSRLGDEVRPLTAVLVASERYGAPLVDGLERVAADVRLQRQRRAEEAAGQIPVRLLFPLVGCILPAFALLTVAPLLAGALRSLRH